MSSARVEEIRQRFSHRPNHVIQDVFAAYDALTEERDRLRAALEAIAALPVYSHHSTAHDLARAALTEPRP